MTENQNETRWSLVALAKGDSPIARAALSELCEIYYGPVHGLMKRWAKPGEARDLTHSFFARILENHSIKAASPEHGRFRNYLFAAARHFVDETNAKANRQKRGGDVQHLALDEISVSDSNAPSPDIEFDRTWGYALIEQSLSLLAKEMEEKGKLRTFKLLRPWLDGDAGHGDQIKVADKLEISETAIRVLVYRMRIRLREIIKAEIAQTLNSEDDVITELREILGAW